MPKDTDYYTNFVSLSSENTGRVSSANGLVNLEILLEGAINDRQKLWSAEQLFAGAINACLMDSFLQLARAKKMTIRDYLATAVVRMEEGAGAHIAEILIKPSITLAREDDRDAAEHSLLEAKETSPVLQSTTIPLIIKPEWALLPEP